MNGNYLNSVDKLGNRGWGWNTRLLFYVDATLAYYRKVPFNFAEDQLMPTVGPKQKIDISTENVECSEITPVDIQRRKKLSQNTDFKVTFPDAAFMHPKPKNPKSTNINVWYFRTENEEEKQEWLRHINGVSGGDSSEARKEIVNPKAYDEIKEVSNEEIDDSHNNESNKSDEEDIYKYNLGEESKGEKSESESDKHEGESESHQEKKEFSSNLEPLRHPSESAERIDNRAQFFEGKDLGEIDYNHQEKAEISELIEEIQSLHEKQQRLFDRKQRKEAKAWDLKFQKYWGNLIGTEKNDVEDSMKNSERLIDHIGKFGRTAEFYAKLVVNEMHKPYMERKFHPIEEVMDSTYRLFTNEDINCCVYYINGLILKITGKDEKIVRSIVESRGEDVFFESKWKLYGREYLSMDVLFDSLFILSRSDAEYKLRVPLSCLVDYKGFRVLIMGHIPLNPEVDPAIGLNSEGKYHSVTSINKNLGKPMSYIAEVLNLKEHNFTFQNEPQCCEIQVSPLIEVHRRHIIEMEHKNSDDEDEPEDFDNKKQMDFHFYELDYDEDIYYILKTTEIFPIDYTIGEHKPYELYLRPEYVCNYDKPLRSDILNRRIRMIKTNSEEAVSNEFADDGLIEITEAKRHLEQVILPQLVDVFDSLSIIPIDSASLTQALHSQGVNIRYLGVIAEASSLSHIKDICITDMLARTAKNIFQQELSEAIKNMSSEEMAQTSNQILAEADRSLLANCIVYNKSNLELIHADHKDMNYYNALLKDGMHSYLLECARDFMNLVFGDSADSHSFWKNILLPDTAKTFNYSEERLQKATPNLNSLLFSFTYYTGIELEWSEFSNWKREGIPFQKGAIKDLKPSCKVFALRVIPYKVIAERYKEYRNSNENEFALRACKMKMTMTKYINNKVDVTALAEIAEILLEEHEIDKAIEKAQEGLKHIPPNHAEAIKFYCILIRAYYIKENKDTKIADEYLIKSINTLNYHWGQFHPLFATVYSIYAFLIITYKNDLEQAEKLYKASLMCCTRVLGPNHLHTAELYMDFGRLYLKMGNKEQALSNLERAFLIYESRYEKNALPTANAAFQIASIMEEQRRFKDALPYGKRAVDIYANLYGQTNEMHISCQWMVICITYSLLLDDYVGDACRGLFQSLRERDKLAGKHKIVELDNKMDTLKENCVAASILTATRILGPNQKRALRKIAEMIYSEWTSEDEEEMLVNQPPSSSDAMRVVTLGNLNFDEEGKVFLLNFFIQSPSPKKDGIFNKFQDIVDNMVKLYDNIGNETTFKQEHDSYTPNLLRQYAEE